jgi:hypothetical protein
MCKAILAFALLFQVVPRPVLAQDASATDCVEQLSAARFELATSSTNAARPWPPRVIQGAVAREATRLALSMPSSGSTSLRAQQQAKQRRSVVGRHPVLFGTLVGFGSGFLIGYLPGDDGVFDDFTGGFNGLVLGGVGAGIGAGVGAIVGAATK